MTHIKYDGPSDSYELSANDLKQAGVEGFKKTTFPKDQPVEVSDEVAKALVENESTLFGQFSMADAPDGPEVTADASDGDDASEPKIDSDVVADSGHVGVDADNVSTPAGTRPARVPGTPRGTA